MKKKLISFLTVLLFVVAVVVVIVIIIVVVISHCYKNGVKWRLLYPC